jgi:hypothetical protein
MIRRVLTAIVLGLVVALVGASPASADPAGPTDYRSEVIAVEPETATITTAIIGGDSFFELTVAPGSEVVVVGYQGEDYLWFRADGTVLENRNSPSVYLNEDRFGGGEVPSTATADAEPDWVRVGGDGHYAWHDHRAHWMQEARPFGRGPGDRILESVIPLVVDGAEVDVTVVSTWQPAASPLPAIVGGLLGVASGAVAFLLRRRGTSALWAATPAVGFAVVAGVWQFRSLPPETGPRAVWWILPVIALASTVVGLVLARHPFVGDAATLVVGAELAVWGFVKRDGLTAAIVPTDAPGWLDRFATTFAAGTGVALVAVAVWFLFVAPPTADEVSAPREPTGSPRPVHP